MSSQVLAEAIIWIALFILIAGPVHECAHAFTAWRLGDGTARRLGRITLDPFAHFDPIGGTLLTVSVALGNRGQRAWIRMGQADTGQPVQPARPLCGHDRRGGRAALESRAGRPLRHRDSAVLWANGVVPRQHLGDRDGATGPAGTGIRLNVVLLLFNLIPIPPLDGSHVLFDFLDPRTPSDLQRLHEPVRAAPARRGCHLRRPGSSVPRSAHRQLPRRRSDLL